MTNETQTPEVTMHHATRAKYDKLAALLAAEYPALTITPHADDIGKLHHFETWHDIPHPDDDGETRLASLVLNTKKVPELADIFGACEDADLDPEAIEVDEDKGPTSSIVPENYRLAYREQSSTGRCNGDWLAEQLAMDCLNAEGKLVVEDFTAILEKNGVDMSGKWAQARFNLAGGGAGRYRMNGRQVLEKTLAKAGVYIDHNGTEHTPSPDFMADIRSKHAKWLAKEAKREQAAESAIKEAVEGADEEA